MNTKNGTTKTTKTTKKTTGTQAPTCVATGREQGSLFHGLSGAMKARLAAVTQDKLRKVNAELVALATTILGAAPALATLRPRIARELPGFDLGAFDALEEIARAGLMVQHAWDATPADDALPALFREADELRTELVSEARPAARRGDVSQAVLDGLALGNGYKDASTDVGALVTMLLAAWPKLEGRTGIELAKLHRGRALSVLIVEALAKREAGDPALTARALERQQMFSLMFTTYQQARRAVEYLRFDEGDADRYAPSVFAKTAGVRYGSSDEEAQGEGSDDAKDAKGAEGTKDAKGVESARPAGRGDGGAKPGETKEGTARGPTAGADGKPQVPQGGPFMNE